MPKQIPADEVRCTAVSAKTGERCRAARAGGGLTCALHALTPEEMVERSKAAGLASARQRQLAKTPWRGPRGGKTRRLTKAHRMQRDAGQPVDPASAPRPQMPKVRAPYWLNPPDIAMRRYADEVLAPELEQKGTPPDDPQWQLVANLRAGDPHRGHAGALSACPICGDLPAGAGPAAALPRGARAGGVASVPEGQSVPAGLDDGSSPSTTASSSRPAPAPGDSLSGSERRASRPA